MQNWKTILIGSSIIIFLFFIFYVLSYGIIDLQIDYLWFKSLGYETYFLLKEGYINTVDVLLGTFFFLIFLINLRLTDKFFNPLARSDSAFSNTGTVNEKPSLLRRIMKTRLVGIYGPLSLILTLPIMIPIHDHWELAVFYFYGDSNSGILDPAYGKDVGFYLFSYPFYKLLQKQLALTIGLLLIAVCLIYYLRNRKADTPSKGLSRAAGLHLNILILVFSAILVWGFLLARYELLFSAAHEPLFFGPGFVEMHYALPLVWLESLAFLVATGALLRFRANGKGLKTLVFSGGLFAVVFALLKIEFLPGLLEKYWVQANPVQSERRYMEYNIASTLSGYGLDEVETENYDHRNHIEGALGLDAEQDLNNIPVWDADLLDDVYNQLQTVRPYFNFHSVDVDRYTVQGYYQQVNLAAREINIRNLPPEAKSWENNHLRYTHGYGAVITPAYQRGEKPMRCFLCDIELKSPVGFEIKHPEVYYGTEDYTYAIVPNRLEPGSPDETDRKTQRTYDGSGDIAIDSAILGKLLFALYFKEPNIFFSTALDRHSRVLLHRNIVDRIKKLTPFFKLDADPYLVVTKDRLFWIQDAYTTSVNYPVSKPSEFTFVGDQEPTHFNYIRNSLKIVVDAYDGSTHFYIVDPKDPIIRAFDRAFPGLFGTMEQMPEVLKSHLRYPEDLFSLQLKIYAKYHQKNPELFFQRSQSWAFAQMDGEAVKPYYVTIHKPDANEQIFTILSPMTPVGQDNLSALVLAGCFNRRLCMEEYAPRILVLKFPGDSQIDGPGQISALINQNPRISQKLTLWNQKGSQIKRGRMLILPIGEDILYIQPVYLLSRSRSRIPQLIRVIVSKDKELAIESSLEEGLASIDAMKKARLSKQDNPAPPLSPQRIPLPYVPPSQRSQ